MLGSWFPRGCGRGGFAEAAGTMPVKQGRGREVEKALHFGAVETEGR